MQRNGSKPVTEIVSESTNKQTWEKPSLSRLPALTELTLQTGPAIPGGGSGGGTVF